MNKKGIFLSTIICLILGGFLFLSNVYAASVSIIINREYIVNTDQTVKVVERRLVKNNLSNSHITKENNYEIFTITALYDDENNRADLERMVASAVVRGEDGWNLNFNTEYRDNSVLITVAYPEDILFNETYTFTFEYSNSQLSQKNGALNDVFIQGFSKDFKFTNANIDYSYNTTLKVPTSLGAENFVSPSPKSKSVENGFDVYKYTQNQLVDNYVWVQRGVTQYYHFTISQSVEATESSNTGNKNEYKIILPRSLDALKISQKVYFTSITPEPKFVEQDMDGNLIGVFEFPSNESRTIRVEGYASVDSDVNADIENTGTIAEAQTSLSPVYISDAPFWEVDESEIQQKASQLAAGKTLVYEVLDATYQDIVNSIDYSNVKRFGINERQGALKTLQGGAAVCMEYSDLYIALLRAQGIPARAAFGYGYDSKDPSDKQELHQWAQAYIPAQKKWLNVDVTWGENGPALIGGDMNHFLTHVASVDPNTPATLSGKTFGVGAQFQDLIFDIEVVDALPSTGLQSTSEIINKYPATGSSRGEEVFDSYIEKLRAGIESFNEEGFNLKNSAQIVLFSTLAITAILIITALTIIAKLLSHRKIENNLHSLRSIDAKKI